MFEEPEDTYGQARVRTVATGSTASTVVISASTTDSTTAIESVISTTTGSRTITTTSGNSNQLTPIAEDVPAPQQIATVATREVSRTTQWRRARKRKQQLLEGPTPLVEEKRPGSTSALHVISLWLVICLVGTGHANYKRQKFYCPFIPGQIPKEEWMAKVKAEDTPASGAGTISESDTDEMD